MATIAFYKGEGLIGNKLIRLWTRSIYSHCELIVGEYSYSSSLMDGGVRRKAIVYNPENWDFVELGSEYDDMVLSYFEKTKHQSYSFTDLFLSQILNTVRDSGDSAFCSEWCAAAIGIPNPTLYSPKTLKSLAEYLIRR